MHAIPAFRHWVHVMHDEGARLMHTAQHAIHERAFWAVLGIFAMIVLIFSLLALLGSDTAVEYRMIYPYAIP